jgi:hypothetical protein
MLLITADGIIELTVEPERVGVAAPASRATDSAIKNESH